MKNFNVEWIVPVIVGVVFVVGNIMRILNWKNEKDKKTTRRPREFQIPKRPPVVQPVRQSEPIPMVEAVFPATVQRLDPPPRPLGRLESAPVSPRPRPATDGPIRRNPTGHSEESGQGPEAGEQCPRGCRADHPRRCGNACPETGARRGGAGSDGVPRGCAAVQFLRRDVLVD